MKKLKELREKYLPYDEKTLRGLCISITVIFIWLLVWMLLFKFSRADMLIRNYINITQMTIPERIMWDLIPFNYRGDSVQIKDQITTTILNAIVFAPFGVLFNFIFKKRNILRDAFLAFGISLAFELTQLATVLGNIATEDLITNTFGYFIGLGIYYLIFKRLSTKANVIFFAAAHLLLFVLVAISIVTTIGAADVIWAILTKTV